MGLDNQGHTILEKYVAQLFKSFYGTLDTLALTFPQNSQ